jgi:hypothetical protein
MVSADLYCPLTMIPESMKITDSRGGEKFGAVHADFIALSQLDVRSIADREGREVVQTLPRQ